MSVFMELGLALLGGALLLPAGVASIIGGKPPRAVGLVLLFAGTVLLIAFGDAGLLSQTVDEVLGLLENHNAS